MEKEEVLTAAKIVIMLLAGYYAVSELSNPYSIFGKYMWMIIIALIAVSITSFFSRLGMAGR